MENFLELLNQKETLYVLIALLSVAVVALIVFLVSRKKSDYNRRKIKKQLEEMQRPEVEIKEEKSDIESVLEEMEKNLKKEEPSATFEEEQEEKAIISYQDLLENVRKNELMQMELDSEKEDDYVEELSFDLNDVFEDDALMDIKKDSSSELVSQKIDEVLEPITSNDEIIEPPKFKNSEFISPIFGRMDGGKAISYKEKESPPKVYAPKIEVVTEEKILGVDPNEEFLESLKEFRRNLE